MFFLHLIIQRDGNRQVLKISKVILTEQIGNSLTQEQADQRYLQRSGGSLSSDFTLSYGSADVYGGKISLTERDGYTTAKLATNDEYAQIQVNRHGVAIGCGDGAEPGEISVNNIGVVISGNVNAIYGSELSIDRPNAFTGGSEYVTVRFGSGGGEIIGLSDPLADSCAANKAYVDATKPILRTATLTTSGWSGNSQTVTVNGIVADTNAQLIYVSPANKASATAWGEAGVFCSAQAANSLTFVCDSTPSANISVNISIQEART